MNAKKMLHFLKRNSPTILTCIGAVGVMATSVLTAKATLECSDTLKSDLPAAEKVKKAAPIYIPAAAIGGATIFCIAGSNVISKNQQLALASSYALAGKTFKEYREKLIELHGEEIDEEVRAELVRSDCSYHQTGIDIPDQKVVFYDEISGNSVTAYEREIMDAEYHINRNFVMRGYAPLNEFYEFMGLPKTEYGEKAGWTMSDGYCWIDFEHKKISNDDDGGPDIYSVYAVFGPDEDYLREWE